MQFLVLYGNQILYTILTGIITKAVESIKEILANKSIVITDLEIKMLIEEQCNEFNQQRPKYQGKHIE